MNRWSRDRPFLGVLGLAAIVSAGFLWMPNSASSATTRFGALLCAALAASIALFLRREARKIAHAVERRFWRDLAWANGALTLAYFATLALPATSEFFRAIYYLMFLLALEQTPDRSSRWVEALPDRRLEIFSPTVFLLGLGFYFYVVPTWSGTEIAFRSRAFDAVLLLYLSARLLHLMRSTRSQKWHGIYAFLLTGTGLLLAALPFADPWAIPSLPTAPIAIALVVVARRFSLRSFPIDRSASEAPEEARLGASLRSFLAALAFPLTHALLDVFGRIPEPARDALNAAVLLWLTLMGVTAMIQRWFLERRSQVATNQRLELGHELSHTKLDLRAILEHRDRSERLRIAEASFEAVFRTFPEALVVLGLYDGRHLEINDGYAKMIGHPRDQILGRSVARLDLWIHPRQGMLFIDLLEEEGRIVDCMVPFRHHQGQIGVFYFAGNLFEFDEKPTLLAVSNDVTESCFREAHDALQDHRERSSPS